MRIVTESVNTIVSGTDKTNKENLDQYAHSSDFYNHYTNTGSYGHVVLVRNKTGYGTLTFNTPYVHPLAHIKSVKVTGRFGFSAGSNDMKEAWYELWMNGHQVGTRQTITVKSNSNAVYSATFTGVSMDDLNNIGVRVGGRNGNSFATIGWTEGRSIFVYGIDIDIEYDIYYYQITTNLINCKETLNRNGISVSNSTTPLDVLNSLPVGAEKMFAICGVSRDCGVIGANRKNWAVKKFNVDEFTSYGTANLNEAVAMVNMSRIKSQLNSFALLGDAIAFKFKKVSGGFTIQNQDGFFLTTDGWNTTPMAFTLSGVDVASSGTTLIYLQNNPSLVSIGYGGNYLRWDDTSLTWRDAVSSWESWLLYEVNYTDTKTIEGIEHSSTDAMIEALEEGTVLYDCKVDGVETHPIKGYNGNPYFVFNDLTSDHTLYVKYSTQKILTKRDDKWHKLTSLFKKNSATWVHFPLKRFIEMKNTTLLETPYTLYYKQPLTTPSTWSKGIKLNHNSGVEETSTVDILTDYISVDKSHTYLMSAHKIGNDSTSIKAILAYAFDANKNYLGRIPGPSYDCADVKPVYCYFDAPNGYNAGKDTSHPVTSYEPFYEDFDATPYIFNNQGNVSCEDSSHNNMTYTGNVAFIRIRVSLGSESDYKKDIVIQEEWFKLYVANKVPVNELGVNDSVVGTISNNAIMLSSSLNDANYSLAYENEKGVMINGWGKLESINGSVNGFINENVAPYVASKLGVYDKSGVRKGYVDIDGIKPVYGDRLYRFGIVSDVHYNDNDDNNTIQDDGIHYHSDLICGMKFFEDKEDVEFVCCGGDITSNSITQAKTYHDAMLSYSPTTNIYTCKGNHDNAASYGNEALWTQYTYPANNPFTTYFYNSADPTNIYSQSNGSTASYYFIRPYQGVQDQQDVFVFYSLDYNSSSPNSDGTRYYDPNSITWLNAVLEKYKKNRVFLFTHLFFWKKAGNCNEYYYPGNHDAKYVLFGSQYDTLNALNNRYKNVIWFTGHSHYKWRYQQNDVLASNGPHYKCNVCNYDVDTNSESAYNVHIPSLACPLVNSLNYQQDAGGSECGIVDVYTDCVVVRGIRMDNSTNQTYEYRNEYVPIAQYRLGVSYDGSHVDNRFANGHAYVDLGLPSGTFWAECNVNATSPEDTGSYYAWGETVEKDSYTWSTYKYGTSETTLTKYNFQSERGNVDNKRMLDLEDDAANANMGGSWHMPTSDQIKELIQYTTVERTSINGIDCNKVISTINGKYIIIPYSGNINNKFVINETKLISCELEQNNAYACYDLWSDNKEYKTNVQYRYRGNNVRGVL